MSALASKIVATLGGTRALAQRVGYANAAGGGGDNYFTPRCGACPGYVCSVGSSGSPRNWPALAVNARLDKQVKGVTRPGLMVKPMMDKVEDGVGGKYRQLGYFIQKEGAATGRVLLATTSESPGAEVQVRLTMSPSRPW